MAAGQDPTPGADGWHRTRTGISPQVRMLVFFGARLYTLAAFPDSAFTQTPLHP